MQRRIDSEPATSAASFECSSPGGPGTVDWTNLKLVVDSRSDRTVGAWKDRRVQEQDALDSIAPRMDSAARRIPVTADSTAGDLYSGGELGARLEDGSRSWQVTETRYHQSGGVEMAATLDLRTWLLPALAELAVPTPRLGTAEGAPTKVGMHGDAGWASRPIRFWSTQPILRASLLAPAIDAGCARRVRHGPGRPSCIQPCRRPVVSRAASADGAALVLLLATYSPSAVVAGLVAARRVVIVIDHEASTLDQHFCSASRTASAPAAAAGTGRTSGISGRAAAGGWRTAGWMVMFAFVGALLVWMLRPVLSLLAASVGIAYVLDPATDWLGVAGSLATSRLAPCFVVVWCWGGGAVVHPGLHERDRNFSSAWCRSSKTSAHWSLFWTGWRR